MISLTLTVLHLVFEGEHHCRFVSLSFPLLGDDEYDYGKAAAGSVMGRRMGLTGNPLDGAVARVRGQSLLSKMVAECCLSRPQKRNSCTSIS